TTLIVVTHDPSMGERARRRLMMEDGALRQDLGGEQTAEPGAVRP
ncbi:MAG: macrolide ABC transporter ATP-binding protein, partial [Azoarcus sp.]|nr:macrolide ABC transporter ATP-binding protein [Azoarcus sp.]